MRRGTIALMFVVLWLTTPGTAHAYLDPNAGSLLLQLLAGGVAGGILLVRLFWRRLRSLFGPSRPVGREDDER